jgi:hypothetical protein
VRRGFRRPHPQPIRRIRSHYSASEYQRAMTCHFSFGSWLCENNPPPVSEASAALQRADQRLWSRVMPVTGHNLPPALQKRSMEVGPPGQNETCSHAPQAAIGYP